VTDRKGAIIRGGMQLYDELAFVANSSAQYFPDELAGRFYFREGK
jgi:hypothetical protein